MVTNNFQSLFEFVDIAEKNRKYPSNTAMGMKAALKMFEQELNPEEKESLDTFKERFDNIYQSVFSKNKSGMSAGSLETYKRRILSLIRDYEKYGSDPTKLASWSRKPIIRKSKKNTIPSEAQEGDIVQENIIPSSSATNRIEISVRPGVKAILLLPSDLTKEESLKVIKFIEAGIN